MVKEPNGNFRPENEWTRQARGSGANEHGREVRYLGPYLIPI